MLIESAALYATWSIVCIIVYVMDNPGQYVMVTTLCNVQVHLIFPTLGRTEPDAVAGNLPCLDCLPRVKRVGLGSNDAYKVDFNDSDVVR
jgi:hypothetical protein